MAYLYKTNRPPLDSSGPRTQIITSLDPKCQKKVRKLEWDGLGHLWRILREDTVLWKQRRQPSASGGVTFNCIRIQGARGGSESESSSSSSSPCDDLTDRRRCVAIATKMRFDSLGHLQKVVVDGVTTWNVNRQQANKAGARVFLSGTTERDESSSSSSSSSSACLDVERELTSRRLFLPFDSEGHLVAIENRGDHTCFCADHDCCCTMPDALTATLRLLGDGVCAEDSISLVKVPTALSPYRWEGNQPSKPSACWCDPIGLTLICPPPDSNCCGWNLIVVGGSGAGHFPLENCSCDPVYAEFLPVGCGANTCCPESLCGNPLGCPGALHVTITE